MTTEEFIAILNARTALLNDPNLRERLALIAANQVSVDVKRRVFQKGIAQDGLEIGKYSSTSAYFPINKPGLPSINPLGKNRRKPGQKQNKTFYAKDGYSQYRKRVGRQNNRVDLNLTGSTALAVGVGQVDNRLPAFGIKNADAVKIIDGNEQRFKANIITPSKSEVEAAREAVREELRFIFGIPK